MSIELEVRLATVQGELDALKAEYSDYAYIVSHDLAAPFRQIEGFANIILSNHGDQFDEKTRRHFDLIIKGSEKGARIVEALLVYSRIRTETVLPSTVNCNTVVADVLAELTDVIQESSAEYTCAEMPVIQGDAAQIHTLFFHLIHNALLYHKPGSHPVVAIDVVEVGDAWEFSIADNGIGIPEKDTDNVFMALKRAVADKDYLGLGMGLSIAKCIVQHHGGKIWVQPKEGDGCTLHFTLSKTMGFA